MFEEIVREIISAENPSYFNQGLMELGALICIPKIQHAYFVLYVSIAGYAEGVQKELPVKVKRKPLRWYRSLQEYFKLKMVVTSLINVKYRFIS